jgi:hypothetical protein
VFIADDAGGAAAGGDGSVSSLYIFPAVVSGGDGGATTRLFLFFFPDAEEVLESVALLGVADDRLRSVDDLRFLSALEISSDAI